MDGSTDLFSVIDQTSATITLADGRQLGYAQYGSGDGVAVVCLHGLPGSRVDFARSDLVAKTVGARIIAVDRPGIGLSSPHPQGTLLSFAEDVKVLTEKLDLSSYAVLGGSAGGPYSMACAFILPADKLKALAIVCGLGDPDVGWLPWMAYNLASWIPSFTWRWYWGRMPEAQVRLSPEDQFKLLRDLANKSTPHEREGNIFRTDESVSLWLKTSREAYKHGVDGPVEDTMRLAGNWGFRVQDIRSNLPVRLWYGTFDHLAPVAHGKQIAARLGRNAQIRVRNETHGSMFVNRSQEYLAELVELVKTSNLGGMSSATVASQHSS